MSWDDIAMFQAANDRADKEWKKKNWGWRWEEARNEMTTKKEKTKICSKCGFGKLVQLANDSPYEDICYCPVCETIHYDTIAWETFE